MMQLADDIWVESRDFKMMGADLGNRMTIIRLPSGKLVLHSPVNFSLPLSYEIDKLGSVAYIITPNNYHGLFVEDWCSRYPEAAYHSAKEKSVGQFVSLDENLEQELELAVKIFKVNGAPKLNEFEFLHVPSKTLILTDIAFNFGKDGSLWSKVFYRINGAYNQFGPSRLLKSLITDKNAFYSSINKMLQYEFLRIVVSHGNILDKDTVKVFHNAFKQFSHTSINHKATET